MNPYSTDDPPLYLLAGETEEVDQYVAKVRYEAGQRLTVIVLRGSNMQSMDRFYDEMAAALQFPLYFGRNWNALDECLVDLDWLPSNAYLLVFADAPSLLRTAGAGDAGAFWKLLSRSSKEWSGGGSLGGGLTRKPTPFHAVLHASGSEAEIFSKMVKASTGNDIPRLS